MSLDAGDQFSLREWLQEAIRSPRLERPPREIAHFPPCHEDRRRGRRFFTKPAEKTEVRQIERFGQYQTDRISHDPEQG